MNLLSMFASLAVVVAGCGQNSSSGDSRPTPKSGNETSELPLAGTFEGLEWAAATSWANYFLVDSDRMMFSLSEQTISDPCEGFGRQKAKSERFLLFSADSKVGRDEGENGMGKNITFTISKEGETTRNLIGSGWVDIVSITRFEISGKVSAEFDQQNRVTGTFKAKKCSNSFKKPDEDFVADGTPNAKLAGIWTGFDGEVNTDWRTDLDILKDGTLKTKTSIFKGTQIVSDGDQSWKTDSEANPPRLIFETTAIRTNTNGLLNLGKKEFCIYEHTDGPKTTLRIKCGTIRFPSTLPKDDGDYNYVLNKK